MRLVATILFLFFYIPTWGCLRDLVRAGDGLAVWAIIGLLSFVAILVHEMGHALAARWAGARVINIVAIPFELRLRPMRLAWAPTAPGRDIGGYVTYTFDEDLETRREAVIIAAAGPAANFALALVAALFAFWCQSFGWSELPRVVVDLGPIAADAMSPSSGLLPTSAEMAEILRARRATPVHAGPGVCGDGIGYIVSRHRSFQSRALRRQRRSYHKKRPQAGLAPLSRELDLYYRPSHSISAWRSAGSPRPSKPISVPGTVASGSARKRSSSSGVQRPSRPASRRMAGE